MVIRLSHFKWKTPRLTQISCLWIHSTPVRRLRCFDGNFPVPAVWQQVFDIRGLKGPLKSSYQVYEFHEFHKYGKTSIVSPRFYLFRKDWEYTMLDFFFRKMRFANLVNVMDAIVQYMIFQKRKVSKRNLKWP